MTGYHCNLIGTQWCDLFTNRTIFALNRTFFSANENGAVKQNNQSDFKVRLKQSTKFQENERQKVIVWRILQLLLPKLCCFYKFFSNNCAISKWM